MGRPMPLAFQARAVAVGLIAWALAGVADAQGAGQQNVDDVIARILESDPATADNAAQTGGEAREARASNPS